MAKVSYILVILAGFILFNSCSNQQKIEASAPQPKAPAAARIQKSYGAYLAGPRRPSAQKLQHRCRLLH